MIIDYTCKICNKVGQTKVMNKAYCAECRKIADREQKIKIRKRYACIVCGADCYGRICRTCLWDLKP